MTADFRFPDYIDHMFEAAHQACLYVECMNEAAFLADRRTQQAVILNLVILGEASTKAHALYPEAAKACPDIPWSSMRGMRNRIAHGYFDIDLGVVWNTVRTDLPELVDKLAAIRSDLSRKQK